MWVHLLIPITIPHNQPTIPPPQHTNRRFVAPGVPVLIPPVRQFSELPAWIDAVTEQGLLAGKTVAMYCTGGVRCEVGGCG